MALTANEQKQYDEKGIKKKDLIHGAYYRGYCRNSSIARWNATNNEFYYIRSKFGSNYIESLSGPEDEKSGMDYFMPEEKIEPNFVIDFE